MGGASSTGSSVICINYFIMEFTFMVTGRCSIKITDVPMDELSLFFRISFLEFLFFWGDINGIS